MDFMTFFLLVVLIAALQPIVAKCMRDCARMNLIRKIEGERKSRVVLLCHREETMSVLGFSIVRGTEVNDGSEVIRAIEMTDDRVPVDLIVHAPPGLDLPATQIALAVSRRRGKVTVLVPHSASSGTTLIALAGDEIVMSPHAVLGPVEPEIGGYPANSLLRLVRERSRAESEDRTLILADRAERAVADVRETVRRLLADKLPSQKAEELARLLAEGHWTRERPVTWEDLKEAGLPVSHEVPREVFRLMALLPQPSRVA